MGDVTFFTMGLIIFILINCFWIWKLPSVFNLGFIILNWFLNNSEKENLA